MDKLLRLGWWHRREACQPFELPLSHPFEFDFEGRCTRAKIILTVHHRAKGEKKPKSMFHGAICLWCDSFFDGERIRFLSLSLSRTILFFFFFLFSHLLLSKFERLSPFSFFRIYNNNIPSVGMGNLGKKRNERNHSASLLSGEWKICCPPIRNRINVPKQPVKVSIPPL